MRQEIFDAERALVARTMKFYPGLLTFLQSPEGHRLSELELFILLLKWDTMQLAYGAPSLDEGARVSPKNAMDWEVLLRMAREDWRAMQPWSSHLTTMVNYAVGTTGRSVRTVASLIRAPRKPSARAVAEARQLIGDAHDALRRASLILDAFELPRARETARLMTVGGEP